MSLPWNILFIASITQGVFLSIILLIQYQRSKSLPQLLLAILVILFSHNLTNNLVFWNGLFETYPHFLFSTSASRFLFAPLFFGYCMFMIDGRLPKSYWGHFLPFVILFLVYVPFTFQSGSEKLADVYTPSADLLIWGRVVSPTLYWLLSFQLIAYPTVVLRRMRAQIQDQLAPEKPTHTRLRWIQLFSYLFLLFGLMMLLYIILTFLHIGGISKDYPISLVMCICIYGISYLSIMNPTLLKGSTILNRIPSLKYAKSRLPDEYLKRVAQDFQHIVDEKALYLDSDLKINRVGELLEVPKHHISQALSLSLKKTFNEFLNERRVKHAQKLLVKMAPNESIKTVMFMSGFNNRASFNNNFKKHIGMTATEYVKSTAKQRH